MRLTWVNVLHYLALEYPRKLTNRELAEAFKCERHKMANLTRLMWDAGEIGRNVIDKQRNERMFYYHRGGEDEQLQSSEPRPARSVSC